MKENIFSHFPTGKTIFLYFSLAFLLTISTYQRRGGKGTSFFDFIYASEKQIVGKRYRSDFLSPNILQLLIISWTYFTLCLKWRWKPSSSPTTLSLPYVLLRSGIRSWSVHFYSITGPNNKSASPSCRGCEPEFNLIKNLDWLFNNITWPAKLGSCGRKGAACW